MLNIRQVAKLSGVSTATVSRYINKSGNVSEKNQKKIQEILTKYNYKPNKLTNAIFSGRTNDIGLIIQNILNPFFAELINEIEKEAQKKNFSLIICNTNSNKESEIKYYNDLIEKRVSAILVFNTADENIYSLSPIPIIGLEKRILHHPKITTDNVQGITLMFNKLLKTKKNILIIDGGDTNHNSIIRTKTLKDLCEKKLYKYTITTIKDSINDINTVQNIPYKNYDFIFCWNDFIAHKIHSELIKQNLKVPEDVEIVGFDGISINQIFSYDLTTITQNFKQIGKSTISDVEKLIKNEKTKDIYIKTTLHLGTTTKQ